MAQEALIAEIKQMLVDRLYLRLRPEDIPDDAPLQETLGIGSVELFELVVGLEDDYGITFEEDEFRLSLFRNVNSIAAFVHKKLEGKQP